MHRNRNFILLWIAQWISGAGDTFTFLAISLKVNDFYADPGDSARALGMLMIAFALPQLFFGIFAGTLVDRWDRKWVMVASDLIRAMIVPAFLFIQGPNDLTLAFLIAFMASTFSVFFYPARTALLPSLVSETELMTANGWMQLGNTIARLAGPALAGFAVGFWGTNVAFVVDSLSFVLSALLVMSILGVETRARADKEEGSSAWMDLKEGINYAIKSRLLQGVTLGIGIAMLGIGAINVLFIPFLRHEFQASAETLGGLETLQGGGMLRGGFLIGVLGKRLKPLLVAVLAMAVLGIGAGMFSIAPSLTVIMLLMPVAGITLPPINASLQTMIQRGVPRRILGRAGSVMDVAISVTNLLSMGAAGWLGDLIGLRQAFFISGVMVFLGGMAMAWILRGVRLPDLDNGEDPEMGLKKVREASLATD